MKTAALVHRSDSDIAKSLCSEVKNYLLSKGLTKIHTFSSYELSPGCFSKLTPLPEAVFVLGGDGTYLSASRALVNLDIPLLGVNLGSLGFLTEHKSKDVYKIIDKVLDGELKTYTRDLLEVTLSENGKLVSTFKVLNDLVVERGARPQLVRINMYSGNMLISDLKADGLIVSTATGSTAYNLAAGGPIIYPETKAIAITPVAPHSLTSRPIVLPDDHIIKLQLASGDQKANFTLDGILIQEISDKHEIVVTKSKETLKVLKDPNHNYFDLLREKLKFGERD